MRTPALVRYARLTAGLSQRELSRRSAVPQPAIARIESGRTSPRARTLERLLEACGARLELGRLPAPGLDRSAIRRLLSLTPAERARLAVREARNLAAIPSGRSR